MPVTPPPEYKGTGASGKYPTYTRGSGTTTGRVTPTPTYYDPNTGSLKGSGTTTGRVTPTPTYYDPNTGSLKGSGVIIEAPTQILRDKEGQPILNAKGETITIQQVREETIKAKAAEGKAISEKQQEAVLKANLINQQIILTAESSKSVSEYTQAVNETFNSMRYKNAGELIKGLQSKETKILGDKYKIIVSERQINNPFNLTSEEKDFFVAPKQTNIKETPSDFNRKKGFWDQPYFETQNTLTFENQPESKDIFTQGSLAGKKQMFQVERQQYNQNTLSPLIFSTGSIFYGTLKAGESVLRTGRGNVLQNIFLPGTPGSQGFAAETIYSITRPIETIKYTIQTGKEKPFELIGQLAGSKAIIDIATSPVEFQINKVEVPTGKTATKNLIKSYELNIKGPSFLKRIIGNTKVIKESKGYGEYLRKNPGYAEILKAELIMPKPGEMERTTETIITTNAEGKKVIRTITKETPAQPYAERDLGRAGDLTDGQYLPGVKWDNILRRFIKDKKPDKNFNRFTGEEETGGGGGEIDPNNPLTKLYSTEGKGNPFGNTLNLLLGKKKVKLINPEQEYIYLENPLKEKITQSQIGVLKIVTINQINNQIQSNIQTSKLSQTQAQTSIQRQISVLKSPLIEAQKQTQIQKSILALKSFTSQKQTQVQTQTQVQAQAQAQAQVQTQIQAQKQIQKQIQISKQIVINPPTIKIPVPTKEKEEQKKGEEGFNVFVRMKGGLTKINASPLIKGEAINFGAYRVENTPQASFKIAPAKGSATGRFSGSVNLNNFYNKSGLFIEKTSARINTIGELQGITFKGLTIKRQKPNKKKNRGRNIWEL